MGGEVVAMKTLIIVLFAFLTLIANAGVPQITLVSTVTSDNLSASGKDTITVSNVILDADSVGIMVNFNRDSVSGIITYLYVTPQSNSNKSFANADTLTTFDNNDGAYAVFSTKIPRLAGTYYANFYVILTNDDITSSPRTVTMNIYTVKWR